MNRSAVVIAGYYGFGNAGDELILLSLVQALRREDPSCDITVLSQSPDATRRDFGVETVDRWRPWQWFVPMLGAGRFILGGGGLLQESTGPWNHAYYLSIVLLARLLGCRTEIARIGVDPILGRFNRFWTRFVLNHATDYLSVRDEASRRALKDGGVLGPIEIEPDPVFDLRVDPGPPRARRGIALALSPVTGRAQWAQEAAQLCLLLQERLSAPIDLLVFFPAQDNAFASEVARDSAAIRSIRTWRTPAELAEWIPEYKLVVATRYHALVLAAITQTPFIGWASLTKVISLCRSRGEPLWDMRVERNLGVPLEQITAAYKAVDKVVYSTHV